MKKYLSFFTIAWLITLALAFASFLKASAEGTEIQAYWDHQPDAFIEVESACPGDFQKQVLTVENLTGDAKKLGIKVKDLRNDYDLASVVSLSIYKEQHLIYNNDLKDLYEDGKERFLYDMEGNQIQDFEFVVSLNENASSEHQNKNLEFDMEIGYADYYEEDDDDDDNDDDDDDENNDDDDDDGSGDDNGGGGSNGGGGNQSSDQEYFTNNVYSSSFRPVANLRADGNGSLGRGNGTTENTEQGDQEVRGDQEIRNEDMDGSIIESQESDQGFDFNWIWAIIILVGLLVLALIVRAIMKRPPKEEEF